VCCTKNDDHAGASGTGNTEPEVGVSVIIPEFLDSIATVDVWENSSVVNKLQSEVGYPGDTIILNYYTQSVWVSTYSANFASRKLVNSAECELLTPEYESFKTDTVGDSRLVNPVILGFHAQPKLLNDTTWLMPIFETSDMDIIDGDNKYRLVSENGLTVIYKVEQ
jgi:hypothetical protein